MEVSLKIEPAEANEEGVGAVIEGSTKSEVKEGDFLLAVTSGAIVLAAEAIREASEWSQKLLLLQSLPFQICLYSVSV